MQGVFAVSRLRLRRAGPECRPRLRQPEAVRGAYGSRRQSAQAMAGRAMAVFSKSRDAHGVRSCCRRPCRASAIPAASTLYLQDSSGAGHEALIQTRNQLLGLARGRQASSLSARPNGQDDTPQFNLDIDQAEGHARSASTWPTSTRTLSAAWGSTYVNDFIDRGRVKQVYVQGDAPFRMETSDIGRWYVRNTVGLDGAVLGVGHRATGASARRASSATTASAAVRDPGARRRRGIRFGRRHDRRSRNRWPNCRRATATEWTGLSFRSGLTGSQAARSIRSRC